MSTLAQRQRTLLNRQPGWNWHLIGALAINFIAWALFIFAFSHLVRAAHAEDAPKPPSATQQLNCPNPAESCKILFLSVQEERALTGPNGVLDTAAQGRALELGQFSAYLKTRIAGAPQIPATPPAAATPSVDKPASPAQP